MNSSTQFVSDFISGVIDNNCSWSDLSGSVNGGITPKVVSGGFTDLLSSMGTLSIYSGFWKSVQRNYIDEIIAKESFRPPVFYTTLKTRFMGDLYPSIISTNE